MRVDHVPRIVGGHSNFEAHDPSKCPKNNPALTGRCGEARCVDCCGQKPDTDVVECARCGLQQTWRCTFDEDFA